MYGPLVPTDTKYAVLAEARMMWNFSFLKKKMFLFLFLFLELEQKYPDPHDHLSHRRN